jgi:hypothetical protein
MQVKRANKTRSIGKCQILLFALVTSPFIRNRNIVLGDEQLIEEKKSNTARHQTYIAL